ncbi:hypothetical protein MBLNU459_g4834t3 [Dothideomycetes sp. NU459]
MQHTFYWALLSPVVATLSAQTPQMGWNSWNSFKTSFDEDVIHTTADLLVSTGLRDAGYTNLILDAGWQALQRDTNGRQQANASKFPSGISALADYVHSLNLKIGIYSDAGILDCSFSPGSWGYEELDANTYAEWGIDYLKYDNCGGFEAGVHSPQYRFNVMRDALLNSGREILYSLCQWGNQFPWYWADQTSHSYRMSGDIAAKFSDQGTDCACKTAYCLNTGYAGCSILTIIRKMREVSPFQHLGSFADMDMLEIGVANLTLNRKRTHMSFWAALKSPLIIGADLQTLSNETLGVLLNRNLISVNQDSLGQAVQYIPALSQDYERQVWSGPLSGGRTVVLAFNEMNATVGLNVSLASIPGLRNGSHSIRELWSNTNISDPLGVLRTTLEASETKVFVLE